MKRKSIFVTIILLILLFTGTVYATDEIISEEEITVVETWDMSATEEDNVIATLYSDGNLIISGEGQMKDSDYYEPIIRTDYFETVQIEEGVTSIGDYAFCNGYNLTTIQIPSTVENIGDNIFCDCYSLESINVSEENKNYSSQDGVLFDKDKTKIISYPRAKTDVQEYIIPNTVKVIENGAFFWCQTLNSIQIPDGLTTINDFAFYGCEVLTDIEIPNSVTYVGADAFGCTAITNIQLSSNVENIGNSAFADCYSLTNISVSEENEYYSSENGVLFNKDKTTIMCYPAGKTDLQGYTIPNTVKNISDNAFSGCEILTDINIPEGVTNIGYYAFGCCTGLTNVQLPDSIAYIGDYAFSGCTGITNINIPEGITDIGYGVFGDCSSLTNIQLSENIERIEDDSFYGCSSLTSINIPDSVTYIGNYAFMNCSELTNIEIPNSVTYIGEYAFSWCSELTNVKIGSGVEDIKGKAFYGCEKLSSINVNEENKNYLSVDGILFNEDKSTIICYPAGKTDLQEYTIPNTVKNIGYSAFCYCNTLTTINLPEGVLSIDNNAFEDCTGLININIPNTVTHIGEFAFVYCRSLKNIVISDNVTTINDFAFLGCNELTNIQIGNNVEVIGDYAFEDCISLTQIEIPRSVTSIGHGILVNCYSLENIKVYCNSYAEEYFENNNYGYTINVIHDYVEEETIEPTCTEQGYTIYKCSVCENIYNDNYVDSSHTEEIDEEVEATCLATGLTQGKHCSVCNEVIVAQEVVAALGHSFGDWTETKAASCLEDGEEERTCGVCGEKETQVIDKLGHDYGAVVTEPTCTEEGFTTHTCTRCSDTYTDSVTVALGHDFGEWVETREATYKEAGENTRTCSRCPQTETQEIPMLQPIETYDISATTNDNVTARLYEIETEKYLLVISGTGNMKDFTDTDEIPWYEYGKLMCDNRLTKAIIEDGVENIGTQAFYSMRYLEEIDVANTVTTIGEKAFYSSGIKTFIMPDSVESIGNKAFYLSDLTYVRISKNLKEIPSSVFSWCSDLENVEIPEGVQRIGNYAFEYGKGSQNLYIPESVTYIGSGAFSGWDKLEKVEIANGVTEIGIFPFSGCENLVKITVPDSVKTIDDNMSTTSIVPDSSNITAYCRTGSVAQAHFEEHGVNHVLDDNNPIITNVEISEPDWTNQDVTITVTANDELSGLSKYAYSFDGGISWQEENYKTYSKYTEGIVIKVKDCLYNTETYGEEITVYIDKVNPEITNVEISEKDWTNQDVTVTVNATDDLSGFGEESYSFDGGVTWQAENFEIYEENTTGINVKIKDKAGNVVEYPETIDITNIDKVDPSIRLVSGEREACISTILTINATDNLSGFGAESYSFDNGATWQESNEKEYTASTENIVIKIKDKAGNIVTHTESINIVIGHIEVVDRAVEPTCTETGLTEGKHCSRCSEVLVTQEVVDALGHAEEIDAAVDATCTETGLTEGKHCSRCTEVLVAQEEVASLGHEYEETITEPTCTEQGYTTHSCIRCDEEYVDTYTDATGHDYKIKSKDDAVCEEGGIITYECSTCKDTYDEEIEATGHTEVIDERVEPTDIQTGLTQGSHCSVCGETIVAQEVIPSLKVILQTWDISATEDDNVTAYLCEDMTLIIAGNGNMRDYNFNAGERAPWNDYREEIKEVEIKTGIKHIGSFAFALCSNMININIPEGVISIGEYALYRTGIEEIRIPSSVETIQRYALSNRKLKNIIVDGDNSKFISEDGILFNIDKTEILQYPPKKDLESYIIPSSVSVIGDGAFGGNYYLTSIEIPESVTIIGKSAFAESISLESIKIPNSVTIIKDMTFAYSNIATIEIGAGVSEIVYNAFEGCGDLEQIKVYCNSYAEEYAERNYNDKIHVIHSTYEAVVTEPTCTEQGYTTHTCTRCSDSYVDTYIEATGHSYGEWYVTKESTYTEKGEKRRDCNNCESIEKEEIQVINYDKIVETWNISATEDDNVTAILYNDGEFIIAGTGAMKKFEENATPWFEMRESIVQVKIIDGVTNIAENVFWCCNKIVSVSIPDSVAIIEDFAFYCCSLLTDIGENSFESCEGLTSIGRYSFDGVPLTNVIIPERITYIGECAFADCDELINIDVNENNKNYVDEEGILFNIDKTILINYPAKKEGNIYKIPDSVTKIGSHAFSNNKYLENIIIPNSVKNIGSKAFISCEKLTNIEMPDGITDLASDTFFDCDSLVNIKLPTTLTKIGYRAFGACDSIESIDIPINVESIGNAVFEDCDKLRKINVYCNSYAEEYVTQNYSDKLSMVHTYEDTITEPTCTEQGYTTHTCTRCSDSYVDTYTEAKGHSYSEWNITEEATCTEVGSKEKICSVCKDRQTEEIAALGHSYSTEWTEDVAPTCTEVGSKSHHCTRENCDSKADETEVPVVPHSYGEWFVTKNATCEEEGTKERICTVCQDKETGIVEVLGHSYSTEWTEDLAPTCTEDGSKSHHCTRENCDSKKDQIPVEALGHDYIIKETTDAVCEQGGTITYECSRCEDTYDEDVPAKGHSYSEWSVTKEATCTETGTKEKVCSVCDDRQTEEIAALGHSYGDWTIDVAPTCTEVGSKSHHCTRENCDHKTDITEVPVVPHSYSEWSVTKEATCTETGTKEKVCSVCDDRQTEEIAALGHSYGDWTVDKEATCTEAGEKSKHCTRCSDSRIEITVIDPLGHNFGVWVIDKEATYEEEGHKYRVCTNCNTEKEEQVIPNLTEQDLEVQTTYTVKEQDGQKFAVMSSAKDVQEILSNITSNKHLEIVDKSGNVIEDTTKAGTGAKVVEKQSKEVAYTIVVKGDANGDANVDFINDIIGLNNHRLNIIKLDTVSILAGDINEDGKIDFINDIIGINNYRLGIINSL